MTDQTAPEETEREKMFRTLATEEKADAMDFVLNRAPEPGKTFSKEGLDEFIGSVQEFILARIAYHWQDRGKDVPGPANMKVEVRVTIDDKQYLPDADRRPWYVIDGTNRQLDA